MSVYTLVFAGSTPIGNLYAGFFAEHFDAGIGFASCGAIIILLMIPVLAERWKVSGRSINQYKENGINASIKDLP